MSFDFGMGEGIDDESQEVIKQARLVALYRQTLKDGGCSDADALDLTETWLRECFEQAKSSD